MDAALLMGPSAGQGFGAIRPQKRLLEMFMPPEPAFYLVECDPEEIIRVVM